MADLADLYGRPMANHNTGCLINTMATIQWAASIRDYIACETVLGRGGCEQCMDTATRTSVAGCMMDLGQDPESEIPDKPP